ncbi:MAG TPA: hypothetical protein VD794_01595 [Flavisolibacter sp.]|nr:hypothetical protein [Flavisolibacter sp.]
MTAIENITLNFEEIRRRSIILWKGIPDIFYGWQPDAGAMACLEMVRHVLEGEHLFHQIILNRGDLGNYPCFKVRDQSLPGVFQEWERRTRSKYQLWTCDIVFTKHEGKEVIRITQQWEDNDTLFYTVSSICDKRTFQPLRQDAWWKGVGAFSFDFHSGQAVMAGTPFCAADTATNRKRSYEAFVKAQGQYVLN